MNSVQVNAEKKANEFMKEADKKMKGWFGGANKFEESADLFEKAASQFKVAKDYESAARAYRAAGDIHLNQVKNRPEACSFYVQAAQTLVSVDPKEAIALLHIALPLKIENNQFSSAAKLCKDIGELLENQHKYKEAIQAFEDAADLAYTENQKSTGNKYTVNAAKLKARIDDYKGAIQSFEKVATNVLSHGSEFKWAATEHYFRAILCGICGLDQQGSVDSNDIDSLQKKLEHYCSMHLSFDRQREYEFLEKLLKAYSDSNFEAFSTTCYEFDRVKKLDDWTANLLLKIKTNMKNTGKNIDLT